MGAIHYSAVGATFGGPGIADFHDELFPGYLDPSRWDLRGHGGIRLGPLVSRSAWASRFLVPRAKAVGSAWTRGRSGLDIDLGATGLLGGAGFP